MEGYSSAVEIDEFMLKKVVNNVTIWDFAKIPKQEYLHLSEDEQSSLLQGYYNDMLIRFGKKVPSLLFGLEKF